LSGTRFFTAGRDRKKANLARRSSSVAAAVLNHGMGGRIARPFPMCLPVRIARTKSSSVQPPMPVSTSGVRFEA
jgi:hypothetical protein